MIDNPVYKNKIETLPGCSLLAMAGKRLVDMLVCTPVLILISPLLLMIGLIVGLESEGGAFYFQERVGYRGKTFKMYKFRTMYKDRSGIVLGLEVRPGDPRVTRAGRFLRRFKLDEFPQLLNVFKGDMTMIGPRPDIPEQVAAYTDFQRQRLLVRPGLTGVAQVSGNICLPWSERIILDIWYIHNWSLWVDLRVLWHTFKVLWNGEKENSDPFGLRACGAGIIPDENFQKRL